MDSNLETEGLECGEYGEVNAFESTGDGFPTAVLRMRVLMMAKEAYDTACKIIVSTRDQSSGMSRIANLFS